MSHWTRTVENHLRYHLCRFTAGHSRCCQYILERPDVERLVSGQRSRITQLKLKKTRSPNSMLDGIADLGRMLDAGMIPTH
jgi:hypothetical protein